MIPYYGDYPEDHVAIRIPFNTFSSNDPSASVTVTNLADADIMVHKDGSLTQIATDGASVVIDFDSITGNHMILIDSSVDAAYSAGSEYAVRVEGITVDAGTLNAWIGTFSIERAGGVLAYLKAGSTVAASVTGAVGSVTGAVGSVTGAVGSVTGSVGSVTGHTAQTGDTYALASGATGFTAIDTVVDGIQTDLSNATDGLGAIKADTAATLIDTAVIGALGAGLTAVPWNAAWDAEVQSEVADALAVYDPPTNAEMEARTLVAAAYFDPAADTVDVGAISGSTTAAATLEAQMDAYVEATATAVAAGSITLAVGSSATDDYYNGQAVWITSASTGAGQFRLIDDYNGTTRVASISPNWAVTPTGTIVYVLAGAPASTASPPAVNVTQVAGTAQTANDVGADVNAILEDTGTTLPATLTTIDNEIAVIDGIVDTIVARVIGTIAAGTHTAQSGDAFARLGAPVGASVSADLAVVDGNVDAILVDTAEIGAAGAGLTALATAAALATVDSNVDAILVDTGTTLPATLTDMSGATFSSATDSLEAIRNRGDAAWTTGAGGTPPQLLNNTTIATLATQTSFTLTAGSADNDAYNNAIVVITDSATSTQKAVGTISDYVGSTRTVTLAADPAIFTMAVGDTVDVIASTAGITQSDVRAAVGLATANLDTQLAAIDTVVDAVLVDTGTTLPATLTTIDTEIGVIDGIVDAILLDTAEIGAAGAGLTEAGGTGDHLTALATAAALATVDGIADAILLDTAEIGTAGAGLTEAGGTGDQLTALATSAALATVDGIVDAILLDTAEIGAAGAGLTEAGGTGDHLTALATAANLAAQRSVPVRGAAFTFNFKMVDATDFATPEAGLTVTAQRSLDAGAFGGATGTVTAIANGIYQMAASAADMTADVVTFRFTAAGAAATTVTVITDGGV